MRAIARWGECCPAGVLAGIEAPTLSNAALRSPVVSRKNADSLLLPKGGPEPGAVHIDSNLSRAPPVSLRGILASGPKGRTTELDARDVSVQPPGSGTLPRSVSGDALIK